MSKKSSRLTIEQLEDRNLLSTAYGLPWPDSQHLTVSFVPDGTLVDNGNQSSLFQTLNSTGSSQVWEKAILQAIQTWAANSNINVGVVPDGGEPLGTPGLDQGDPRFGDIRIAAEPLGVNGPVAITSPYDPLAGTRSGDMVFNSSLSYSIGGTATSYDVFTVALHEAGHVFNLPDETTNSNSVMYAYYQGPETGLTSGDVSALQSIYGAPVADSYQGTTGNGTLSTSSSITLPDIAGDITTPGQSEFFKFQIPSYANSTVNVTVNTAGLSLFTPSLTIYNSNQQVIATSADTNPLSGDLTITLNNVSRGSVFYFKVSGASSNAFGAGSYRLEVDSGAVSEQQIDAIDFGLNAAIDAGLPGDTIQYVNFNHTTSTLAKAVQLDQSVNQIDPRFDYAFNAMLNDSSDVNYYSVTTPASGTQALIFTASPGFGNMKSPVITMYDANGNPVDAEVLSNDPTSGYVVQLVNPVANAKYYIAVTSTAVSSCGVTGTYLVGVNFSGSPIVLQTIVDATVSATDQLNVTYLQSSGVQLYDFVLSVNTAASANLDITLELQIFDANGNLVTTLTCQNGQTVSANVLLGKGLYAARFVAIDNNGAVIPTTAYSLLGIGLTNPLDPVSVNPTAPTNSNTGTTSTTTTTSTLSVVSPTTPPVLPPVST